MRKWCAMQADEIVIGRDWIIREYKQLDEDFVCNSWLESYRPCERKMRDSVFFDNHRKVVMATMRSAETRIAALAESPDVVIGWLCASPLGVLHYAYTKKPFRSWGIFSTLAATFNLPANTSFTHSTPKFDKFRARAPWCDYSYNPYLRGRP